MACRTTAESEATAGYFANPLCIRATVTGSYEKLLRDVAKDVAEALQHQRVPLSFVCDDLGLDLRGLLQPLFVPRLQLARGTSCLLHVPRWQATTLKALRSFSMKPEGVPDLPGRAVSILLAVFLHGPRGV